MDESPGTQVPPQPIITVDDREMRGAVARRLFERGAKLNAARMEVGDFAASERVLIERKTAADFESSVIDGRLFSQAQVLSSACPAPVLALVGKSFERLHANAIEGALISLLVDFRLPVRFFESEGELADFVYAVAFREQIQEKREHRLQAFKRTARPTSELQQFIVEALPGIGPTGAKALLSHFQTVENVFTADEEELALVEGIGEKMAKDIRAILSARFVKEEQ